MRPVSAAAPQVPWAAPGSAAPHPGSAALTEAEEVAQLRDVVNGPRFLERLEWY